jgi:Putative metallopeptidase domain
MEITLPTVREVLRSTFGRDSFVASFIEKVESDENCPTASIDAHGVMRYNPLFVEQFITSPADLFCLIAHELMHPMFGHFVYRDGQLENIGADMVINATISLLFARHSGSGTMFRRFYKPIGIEGLLRPGSDMHQSRYARLYRDFYDNHCIGQKLSTGEVIQTLKVLTPSVEVPTVVLLGEHRPSADGTRRQGNGQAFGSEALARIAEDLRRVAQRPSGQGAGFGEALYDFLVEVLKTYMSLKRALLDRFTTRQKVDKFRRMVSHPRIGVSPIPIRPSKRDFVLLAAGVPPFHYHNMAYRQAAQERGLAVYLDVSGSVNQRLPEIIGVLRSLKAELMTIFLFSNKVVEVPFRTLLAGQVQTTYGTDFDCIVEHLLERRYGKAVVFTDGYAGMVEDNKQQLKSAAVRVLTVLFGGKQDCPEFASFGDVVQLDAISN